MRWNRVPRRRNGRQRRHGDGKKGRQGDKERGKSTRMSDFGLPNPIPKEIENAITYFDGDFLNSKHPTHGNGLFIGVYEVDAVRANAEMVLEVLLDGWLELVVQVIGNEVGDLLTGLMWQWFRCGLTRWHRHRCVNLVSGRVVQPTCHAGTAGRGEASSSQRTP
jgi:hypothetical protein